MTNETNAPSIDVDRLIEKVENDILFVDDLRQIAAALREYKRVLAVRDHLLDLARLLKNLDPSSDGSAMCRSAMQETASYIEEGLS